MVNEDTIDIGFCCRCGADMAGEPAAALICSECFVDDEDDDLA